MNKRILKDLLYERVSHIGKAFSCPERLEILELLAKGDHSLKEISRELDMDIQNARSHIGLLITAQVIERTPGIHPMQYRLRGTDISSLWITLYQIADAHLMTIKKGLNQFLQSPGSPAILCVDEFTRLFNEYALTVIDVTKTNDYNVISLPYARILSESEVDERIQKFRGSNQPVALYHNGYGLLMDDAIPLFSILGKKLNKADGD